MFGYKRLQCPLGHTFSAFLYGSSPHVVCPQCKALARKVAKEGAGTPPPYDFAAASLVTQAGNSMFAAYNDGSTGPREAGDSVDIDPTGARKP